ncbi:hypothetical protein [Roseivivax halotolerans]|nr:hypothetical protein [Roseivivax halotolerans]
MARKKRPNIQGHNPDYSTNFTSPREGTSTFAAGASERASPAQTPVANEVDAALQVPEQSSQPETPEVEETTPTPVEPSTLDPAPKSKPVATEKPARKSKIEEKRETRLDAAVKVEQGAKLDALEGQGLAARDVIILAGRRATARFELKAKFVEKPEADRLPMREGYHTTKRLPASILDDLREKHDPLRLQSDSAMVRGQFEPLFWTCLDEVIEELRQKKG